MVTGKRNLVRLTAEMVENTVVLVWGRYLKYVRDRTTVLWGGNTIWQSRGVLAAPAVTWWIVRKRTHKSNSNGLINPRPHRFLCFPCYLPISRHYGSIKCKDHTIMYWRWNYWLIMQGMQYPQFSVLYSYFAERQWRRKWNQTRNSLICFRRFTQAKEDAKDPAKWSYSSLLIVP